MSNPWQPAGLDGQSFRTDGHRTAHVHALGTGDSLDWGFTIWEEGMCLSGRRSVHWDARDAERHADNWLARHPETKAD